MQITKDNFVVTGLANIPNCATASLYKCLVITLEISNDVIVNGHATFVSPIVRDYFKSLVCGKNINTDLNDMIYRIEHNLLISCQRAVIFGLKDAIKKYQAVHRGSNSVPQGF